MLLTDLADVARKSGLPVHEVDGWQHRGHGHPEPGRPHHAAGVHGCDGCCQKEES